MRDHPFEQDVSSINTVPSSMNPLADGDRFSAPVPEEEVDYSITQSYENMIDKDDQNINWDNGPAAALP